MKFVNNINLNQNELQNARIQNLGGPPGTPVSGQIYFHSSNSVLNIYAGSWKTLLTSITNSGNGGQSLIDGITLDVASLKGIAANSSKISLTNDIINKNITIDVSESNLTLNNLGGTLGVTKGGTGLTSTNAYGIVCGGTSSTGALQTLSDLGSAGYVLQSNGASSLPSWKQTATANTASAIMIRDSFGRSQVTTPLNDLDIANKIYVDTKVQGLGNKTAVLYATTTGETINLTVGGLVQTIDGVSRTLTDGDLVLVKNQSSASQNGIYIAHSGAWERSQDSDTWTELVAAFVFVEKGATLSDTGWVCTIDQGGVLGIDPVTWVQFSGAGVILAGNGLDKSGNLLFVKAYNGITADANGTSVLIDTVTGGLQFDLSSPGKLQVIFGGSGSANSVAHSDHSHSNMSVKKSFTIGDGVNTSFLVSHNLSTKDVWVTVLDNGTNEICYADVTCTSVNAVTVTFAAIPTTNQFDISVFA